MNMFTPNIQNIQNIHNRPDKSNKAKQFRDMLHWLFNELQNEITENECIVAICNGQHIDKIMLNDDDTMLTFYTHEKSFIIGSVLSLVVELSIKLKEEYGTMVLSKM